MPQFNITITTNNPGSALARFISGQLRSIEWIVCDLCSLKEIPAAKSTDLFVALLEGTSYQEILDACSAVRRLKNTAVYLSFWDDTIIAGPTHFPGSTAGADSSFLFLKQGDNSKMPGKQELLAVNTSVAGQQQLQDNIDVFYSVFTDLLHEIRLIYQDKPGETLKFIDNVSVVYLRQQGKIKPVSKYIYPLFDSGIPQSGELSSAAYSILLSKFEHSRTQTKTGYFTGTETRDSAEQYKNIAIIGGGTAGFMTALSLKKAYPGLPVTLIESSKVPVIGVGEATTPNIRKFLFEDLGFSPLDFYEKVKPTWKLGIKFFWGLPGDYYFNYPFGTPDVRSAYLSSGNINRSSLTALLMDTDSSFVVSTRDRNGAENFSSLSDDLQYALHLDNVSFIKYLKTKALEAGVIYIDDLVIDVEKKGETNEIQAVIGEGGKKYEFDFFVDCTGFKSLLIEKALGSQYLSYSNSLFNDTAVTGYLPNNNIIKPYTFAESMDNGWCWSIPMRGDDHRGYVFSSAHCTVDKAADEMKLKNPAISELKTVRFRSGRHREICIGNVFAIGNSFAFVEPLESTGIHMILKEVEVLTKNLPYLKTSPAIKKTINTNMNAHWDYVRDYLSIHYKFNKKFETKYWKDVRADADISGIQWLIDLYHEVGMLAYAGENFQQLIKQEIKDEIFGLYGFDVVLLGQGVVPKNFNRSFKNKQAWEANVNTWKAIQAATIPISADLKFLAQNLERKYHRP